MTNPDQDPSIEPAPLTAEQRIEQLEAENANLSTAYRDLNDSFQEISDKIGKIEQRNAQLDSIVNTQADQLRRSRLMNKVLGGLAIAAAAVAVWSPFGGSSTEKVTTTPIATKTDDQKPTQMRAQMGTQTERDKMPAPTTEEAEDEDKTQTTDEWIASLGGNDSQAASADRTSQKQFTIGKAKNIATAVENLDIDSTAKRASVLKHYANGSLNLELNNINNKMNAMPAEGTGINKMLTAAGLAMFSDTTEGNKYGKAVINYNSKNNRSVNADTGLTAEQQEAANAKFMTADNAKNYIKNYTGHVYNTYMIDGGEVNEQVEYFENQRVLVREVKGQGTVMWKVTKDKDGKICLNLIKKAPTPSAPSVNVPGGGGQGGPGLEIIPGGGSGGGNPDVPTPSGGGGGGTPVRPNVPNKKDDGQIQGPNKAKGVPDNAGEGDAGQTVRPNGTVGSETLPPAPAPAATPAPIKEAEPQTTDELAPIVGDRPAPTGPPVAPLGPNTPPAGDSGKPK